MQTIDDNRLAQLFAQEGIARGFLAERPIRRGSLDGIDGIFLTVRLTSYRALPLSCLEDIKLRIDGMAVPTEDLRLVLGGVAYAVGDLPPLHDRWWFILDMGELFAPVDGLADGHHDVDATLVTVEPYMTAGRFSMFNPDRRQLVLEGA